MKHHAASRAVSDSNPVVDDIVRHIIATRDYLRGCADKSPHPVLNEMLSGLIARVRPAYDDAVVDKILARFCTLCELPQLRGLLAECEYELEKFWAKKICRGDVRYTDFIYINSYFALVAAETDMLECFSVSKTARFCFIGSGPMPLTAFGIQDRYPQADIQCIERDNEAFFFGKNVALSSDMAVNHILADAVDVDYADRDVIFVAAMVDNKRAVLEKIAATAVPGALVGIRTVEALRQFLYTPLESGDVPDTFELIGSTSYNPDHINTTVFYRLK